MEVSAVCALHLVVRSCCMVLSSADHHHAWWVELNCTQLGIHLMVLEPDFTVAFCAWY